MTTKLIIIAVIILLVYYYYQNNQPHIQDSPETKNLVKDLKRQVQHYQKLYEDRVAKDIGSVKESNSIEIQTDNNFGDDKETQTPFTFKYSRNTQTDLSNKQISLLTQQ